MLEYLSCQLLENKVIRRQKKWKFCRSGEVTLANFGDLETCIYFFTFQKGLNQKLKKTENQKNLHAKKAVCKSVWSVILF